jgi:16S rRNA (cytosine1402-N4)-methyltransferase
MNGTEIEAMATDGAEGQPVHVPVLVREVVELLTGAAGGDARTLTGWVVDGTLGGGGHAAALLAAAPGIELLGVDQDPEILAVARERLAPYGERVRIRHGRLSELGRLLRKERIGRPIGMLFDLGVSSLQLDTPGRGFSFQHDGPLDMRMDPTRDRTAADIVNRWDEGDLADLFYYEGGETAARKIARAVVQARRNAPFLRTAGLAEVVARAAPARGKIHPATRAFQALRRAVNEESDELLAGLAAAAHWLAPGGRLAVIAFHSGEDRAVKRFLVEGASDGTWTVLTRRPLTPAREEERANPRARSAKLRAAERSATEHPGGPDAGGPD